MKRRSLYRMAFCLLAACCLSGCHKVCTCTDYGGREREFTSDEVDEHAGGDCSEMINFPILNHYSYCHW